MIEELKKFGKVIENPSLKEYTTYKIGGKATAMVFPKNEEELLHLITYIKMHKIRYKVLGNGSNVIFKDEGFPGIIIKLDEINHLDIHENIIKVGAGYNMMRLALKLSRTGYTGLEFASGIPGTVGGCVFMNAGAYGSDMGYITREVKVLTPTLEIKTLSNKEMNFHYRTSFLKENPEYICLEATLLLNFGDKEEIMRLISDRKQRRILSQPLEYPSAGSVFRNPKDIAVWKLIESLGYKGVRIGDACVSEKHANFIINMGNAKEKDLKHLIDNIKRDVKKNYGIDLTVEQEFVE